MADEKRLDADEGTVDAGDGAAGDGDDALISASLCVALLQAISACMAFALRQASQRAATVALGMVAGASVMLASLATLLVARCVRKGEAPSTGGLASIAWGVASAAVTAALLVPRPGAFADRNPYSNSEELQCVVELVVGRRFAMPGTMQSDGYVYKVREGEEIDTPEVVARPGLTFVGWRYGGIGEPDFGPGATIAPDANGTRNNAVTLYAVFVDGEGNAYCACGATGEGLFAGTGRQGQAARWELAGAAAGLAAGLAAAAWARGAAPRRSE